MVIAIISITASITGGSVRKIPDDPTPRSALTNSMLVSEWVYRLIVLVERSLRLAHRYVFRPCAYLLWCLRA